LTPYSLLNRNPLMSSPIPVPEATLLVAYANAGAFTDCYETTVRGQVGLPELIEAFYTTTLFKVERWLLATAIRRPSTDEQARALAHGTTNVFAAWTVEGRRDSEVLLGAGPTRSWLSVVPATQPGSTRLLFGSAVVPVRPGGGFGLAFRALLGFHRLYSRLLLSAAARRVVANCRSHRAA
jgi:hypothetical protein